MARWLLAIKPEYICKIANGTKGYELRTRVPSTLQPGDTIFCVESGSDGRVVLSFVITTISRYSPQMAWAKYWRYFGIDLIKYQEYTEGKRYINLIGIQQVRIMKASANIHEIGIKRTPQWFSLLKVPVNDLWIGTPSSRV